MEDKVWDKILQVRSQLNEARSKKDELQMLVESSRKVVQAAAEAAFNSGAEHASIMASELVYATDMEMGRIQQKSERLERDMTHVEVKAIEKINEKAEERAREQERRDMADIETEGENEQVGQEDGESNTDVQENVESEEEGMSDSGKMGTDSESNESTDDLIIRDALDRVEPTEKQDINNWHSSWEEAFNFKKDEDLGK